MKQRSAVGVVAVAIAMAIYHAAIAADSSSDSKPAAIDATQYADFMAGEALDIQDLAEGAEIQRRFFDRITPPGFLWVQPMFPAVVPFNAENFGDSFLDELMSEDKKQRGGLPAHAGAGPEDSRNPRFQRRWQAHRNSSC